MSQDKKNSQTPQAASSGGNPPTHLAKIRKGRGDNASFERIGVAWVKDDGSLYVRFNGTQIISGGFALYPIKEGAAQ